MLATAYDPIQAWKATMVANHGSQWVKAAKYRCGTDGTESAKPLAPIRVASVTIGFHVPKPAESCEIAQAPIIDQDQTTSTTSSGSDSADEPAEHIWYGQHGGITYSIDQSSKSVALLVDNQSEQSVSVKPENVLLYEGAQRVTVCSLALTSLLGIVAPDQPIKVESRKRVFAILVDCIPTGPSGRPSLINPEGPLTRLQVNGVLLRSGVPPIPRSVGDLRSSPTHAGEPKSPERGDEAIDARD